MDRNWKITDCPMTVVDFMIEMGMDVVDLDFWELWQEFYESGGRFVGWDDVREDYGLYEYRRRMGIVQRYRLYRGWWKKEMSKPRAVSWRDARIGKQRNG